MDACCFFENKIPSFTEDLISLYSNHFLNHDTAIFVSLPTYRNHQSVLNKNYHSIRLSSTRLNAMNDAEFNLFCIDKFNQKLIQMQVISVYLYETLPKDFIQLIPIEIQNLVGIGYYHIKSFNILDYGLCSNIINNNTGAIAINAKQMNQSAPWNVILLENGPLSKYLYSHVKVEAGNSKYPYAEGYCVYRYWIPELNMSYIGETGNLTERIKHHENPSSWDSKTEANKHLYLAFKILGREKFQFEILYSNLKTKEEALRLEAIEILNHNAYYPNGFNIRNENKNLS